MSVIAEIFSQGEEVVSGQTVDSNAAWLSQQLVDSGFTVTRHTAVGDDLEALVSLIKEISQRADCCVCTGGLGPTSDDLTTQAVSLASGLALQFDPEAMEQIEQYFAQRQRPMPEANRKQAYFPQGAMRIDNPVGTAPGFAVKINRCWFSFLPGVPSEMKAMFPAVKQQWIPSFQVEPERRITLRSIGIGESTIQQRVQDIPLPSGVRLGFRAAIEEVQTKLYFSAEVPTNQQRTFIDQIHAAIGEAVFAIDGISPETDGDLLTTVDRLLQQADQSLGARSSHPQLALLESVSGGLLAAKCQGKPWLDSAYIASDISQAGRHFNLDLPTHSPLQAVEQLAEHLLMLGADLALVQLHHTHQDSSLLLYNGLLTQEGMYHSQITLAGPPARRQIQAAMLTLDLLRRTLQHRTLSSAPHP